MNCPEPLAAALRQVAAGLPDATNHYFLKANYYDHIGGDEARWWLAAMWLNEETTRNFELGPDTVRLEVLLDGRHLNHWTLISIPYTEIWDILHQRTADSPTPNGWTNSLYYNFATMRMPPVGRAEE